MGKLNLIGMDLKNNKQIGEIGERIAIGELAKYGIDVCLPMSDNLPFDFVIYYNNKFFKCQVKSTAGLTENDSIRFSLTSNNWNKGTTHIYTENEIDIIICCDLKTIYLFKFEELKDKQNIILRETTPKNGQIKGINFTKDYIISKERIDQIFI